MQESYTGRSPVIPSSLADTPCAGLGIQGVLDRLNVTLRTSYTLDIPSLPSILEDCIEKDYDFGTAYGHLLKIWYTDDWSNIQDKLRRREEGDRELRQKALVGNWIVIPHLPPRRVWDLYSNRVMPWWSVNVTNVRWEWEWPKPISHAWVDEKDRVDVWTPINGKEWPVPIPKDASLDLIRIEMLNLGVEYAWLDGLCLRQRGGPKEDFRLEEWKLDIPTIGYVYNNARVVIYLSGLGLPLSLKEGDLDSDRCWFRRVWTLQEVGEKRIFAGDTSDGPLHAKPIDKDGSYETELLRRFHMQLASTQDRHRGVFSRLTDMQRRVSTNPVDKVAGLAFLLNSMTIPAYHESESLEDAWTALVNSMISVMRASFLLLYPGVGLGCKKWRPTWEQLMTELLPKDTSSVGTVKRDDEEDEDWFEGPCIENGHVRGLDVIFAEGVDRCGELVVESTDGIPHTLAIRATHQIPIPEHTYTLLGTDSQPMFHQFSSDVDELCGEYWAVGRRLSDKKFEKVSVVVIDVLDDLKRLKRLGIATGSRNILV